MMLIAIYTSRVVLKVLGVEDYGTYNLVGGVVSLFSSIKGILSSAIQRYINYTRGLGDENGVKHIFSLSVIIQFLLALAFFIVVECFGLWFIPNKLVIPEGMLGTALFVFHCSLIASIVDILCIPFSALVIANEKMDFYAFVSIAESVLKLVIVFLIPLLPFVALKSYSILILLVHLFIFSTTILYCRRFPECRIEKYWNQDLFKRLISFSGWNFLGNVVYTIIHEGTNFILNIFAGVVANAARGIAVQVRSALETLSSNVITASRPFVMQQAAKVDKPELFGYIYYLSRAMFYILLITTIPIIVYCEQLLSIWLIEIPDYTVSFVRTILFFVLVRSLHSPVVMLFFADGNLKRFQITEFIVGSMALPLVYIFLKLGLPLYFAFVAMIIIEIIDLIAIVLVAQKDFGFSMYDYVKNVIIKCVFALLIVGLIAVLFYCLTRSVGKYASLLWLSLLLVCETVLVYSLALSKEEKHMVLNAIMVLLKKTK